MTTPIKQYDIIGGGDLATEVAQYLSDIYKTGTFKVKIWDDYNNPELIINEHFSYGGKLDDIVMETGREALVCVGNSKSRREIAEFLLARRIPLSTFIHPSAIVSSSAEVKAGCIIFPFTCVSAHAVVGYNTILNSHVGVGHHALVGDNCVISPQTLIAGRAKVGDNSFLGSGVVIAPKKCIGSNTKVAAASVVYRNSPDNAFLSGNPARNFTKG